MKSKPVKHIPVSTRLDKHFAGCSAAAVGVASFFANTTPSDAVITYSGIQNAPISKLAVGYGVYIGVEPPFPIAQGTNAGTWDLNPYKTGQSLYVNANTRVALVASGGDTVMNLPIGTVVDGSLNWWSNPGWYGDVGIPTGDTGFIGFQFDPQSVPGAQQWYGWARMSVGNNSTTDGTVIDWAFEDTGAAISVGAVPEPASFAMGALAMGAMGLVALRQRRAKAAK